MATTAASLIDRVRDLAGDWGDAVTTVATDATSTDVLLYVHSAENIQPLNTILVGTETMEVTGVTPSYPDKLSVIRGARSSTAAAQGEGTVVRTRCRWTSKRILDALNAALALSYPKLYVPAVDTSLAILENVYTYDIPTSGTPAVAVMDNVWRVEIENSDLSSHFNITRNWDMLDYNTIRIYGEYSTDRNIRLIGMKRFASMTVADNLDSGYPTNESALSYLVYWAAAELLTDVQVKVAKLDAFIGQTDSFSAGQPYVPLTVAKNMREQATAMLDDAKMEQPLYYSPAPMRRYAVRN